MATREVKGGPTRYYVDALGKYLGGFAGFYADDGAEVFPIVPAGAVQVPSPPQHGSQIWNGTSWGPQPLPSPDPDLAAFDAAATLADKVRVLKERVFRK